MAVAGGQEYSDQLKKFLEEELFSDGEGGDEEADGDCGPGGLAPAVRGGGSAELEAELEEFRDHDVIRGILDQGVELNEYARQVEDRLRQVELESIQDYIQESDNLVSLHEQIQECDGILVSMEKLLGKFQTDLGQVSEEIRQLQTQSQTMSVKLKNRRAAEEKLGAFIERLAVPNDLIHGIMEAEVNEDYLEHLLALHHKVMFIRTDEGAKASAAYQDIEPVVEKLRLKAISKVRDFLLQKIYQLRRPRTNIQIIQQNVLLKFKYFVTFLKDHGGEVYSEVRSEYIKTISRVLSQHFRQYLNDIDKMQMKVALRSDVVGTEDAVAGSASFTSLFGARQKIAPRAPNDAAFELGERGHVLQQIEKQALVPHVADYEGKKFPYEVIFRSVHKLLMDTATTEYLFCRDFFGEDAVFRELFQPIISVVEGEFNAAVQEMYDVICVLLMIRLNHEHRLLMGRRRVPALDNYMDRVNMALWPRFKILFDIQLTSLSGASEKALFNNDPTVHGVARRYASLVSSMLVLAGEHSEQEGGAFQAAGFDHSLERMRSGFCDVLVKVSKIFRNKRSGIIFLIVNYSHVVNKLNEASINYAGLMSSSASGRASPTGLGQLGQQIAKEFEEHLMNCTNLYVEDQLDQHFQALIDFVKKAEAAQKQHSVPDGTSIPGYGSEQADPVLKDFAARWNSAIEAMHKEVTMQFRSAEACTGKDVLQASMTQLLLYYTRLLELVKRMGPEGAALLRGAINIPSIMYEIKRYTRTQ